MSLWNNTQIAEALNAEINFEFSANRVVTDSRNIQKGDLFVALKGDNFDGNEYAKQALEQGAVAAIISNESANMDGKTIMAKNGIYALERLAYHRRKKSKAKIIGITGSVGKTTVKELLYTILSDYYKTHKTEGNLNNHIGLPLSIANMPEDTKIGIFEMGMSAAGEISNLSRIANPDIGIITNIGTSHIEFFDSQEGIAHAKAEIFDWLKIDGTAVIPADSKYFSIIEEIAEDNGVTNILSFGKKINNPQVIDDQTISAHITLERYNIPLEKCREFNLNNILASLTIASEIGIDIDDAVESISAMNAFEGRGNKFTHEKSGAIIINDAYNASPESMKNALQNLENETTQDNGNKIAILGDMLELGKNTKQYHLDLAEYCTNIDTIYLHGENMEHIAGNLSNAQYFDNLDDLQTNLESNLKQGDIALIKGSNGSKMWKIVKNLQKS